jgi:hypothetical protein
VDLEVGQRVVEQGSSLGASLPTERELLDIQRVAAGDQ